MGPDNGCFLLFLALLEALRNDPFQNPPPFEKLVGDPKGAYSRRVNMQQRLVDQVYEEKRRIKVICL